MDLIQARKKELLQGSDGQDLLSMMIKSSLAEVEEARLTDEEVLNDIVIFFFAGHDTTANTLVSTFYFLAKYPEIQEKARHEIFSILGDTGSVIVPSTEQLKRMVYITGIIKESMRILPTVTRLRRHCATTTALSGGLTIPANSYVILLTWAIHHNPDIFPNPEEFVPERFEDVHGKQNQSSLAFSSGARMCIGSNFSMVEQRVVMVMLLQKFIVQLGPNSQNSLKPKLKPLGLNHPIDMDLVFLPRF